MHAILSRRILTLVKKPFPAPVERQIRRMFTRIITALARDMKDDDLSVAQVAALHLVDQGGAVRLSALGDELGLSPSSASRMVDDLVRRGLLSRTEDPEDRRAKLLRVARDGEVFIRKASEGRLRVIADNIGSVIPAPIQELVFGAIARASGPPEARSRDRAASGEDKE